MDWVRIKKIIQKYYEGKTSLSEEIELKQALLRDDCPSELKNEQALFQFFMAEKAIESNTLKQKTNLLEKPTKKSGKFYQMMLVTSTIAAVFALFFLFKQNPNTTCKDQQALVIVNNKKICNEQEAREEAQKALQFVAQQMNKGTSKINNINKTNIPNH